MLDEELKKLDKENKALLQSLDERIKKIEKKFTLNTIFSFIRVIIIAAPLIIGIIYLTPVLKEYIKIFEPAYRIFTSQLSLVQQKEETNNSQNQMDILLEAFCNPDTREAMIRQWCQ
ncbi:MAG: hypothetical protein PHO91_00445 [Patescibacteria group bacterium]|nr:hypothetical protein [Patescibacteria group bacterium]